jgi:hypothetical protein
MSKPRAVVIMRDSGTVETDAISLNFSHPAGEKHLKVPGTPVAASVSFYVGLIADATFLTFPDARV